VQACSISRNLNDIRRVRLATVTRRDFEHNLSFGILTIPSWHLHPGDAGSTRKLR
jgi:hypothetical protein